MVCGWGEGGRTLTHWTLVPPSPRGDIVSVWKSGRFRYTVIALHGHVELAVNEAPWVSGISRGDRVVLDLPPRPAESVSGRSRSASVADLC